MRPLVLAAALLASGCGEGGLFPVYCDDLGVYPVGRMAGRTYISASGDYVCNDLTAQYSCKGHDGVLCVIR